MNRRNFMLGSAALLTGCTRAGDPAIDAMTESAPLGLQLYTVRELMAEDVAATLALVAGIGYREVEFAGYFGLAPDAVRRLLAGEGLAAPSAHIGYGDFVLDVGDRTRGSRWPPIRSRAGSTWRSTGDAR